MLKIGRSKIGISKRSPSSASLQKSDLFMFIERVAGGDGVLDAHRPRRSCPSRVCNYSSYQSGDAVAAAAATYYT